MDEIVTTAVVETVVVIAADLGGFVVAGAVAFLDAPIAVSAACEPAVVFFEGLDSALGEPYWA
jgi:hypothetical protein